MNRKNILLGHGETLTHAIPTPTGGRPKAHPYTFEEARSFLLGDTLDLVEKINEIPQEAKANGKIVAKFLLHPTYIAKSYYPTTFLKEFGFNAIGSKSERVAPRKSTLKGEIKEQVTSSIYMSGDINSFQKLMNALSSTHVSKEFKDEVIKNESFTFFEPTEKIKKVYSSNSEKKFELVLHTPLNENDILEQFYAFSKRIGVDIDYDRRMETGGLTFLPMIADEELANDIAEFTYLRVLREMPKLRIFEPLITRSNYEFSSSLTLPSEKAQDNTLNVAIFDGGIGNTNLDTWCNEYTYPEGIITEQALLNHGSDVTSTILFGNIKEGQTSLPQPYSNIDHYRVLDKSVGADPDLFDVLSRIKKALDSKDYDFVNLSLGPRIPIEDDDVHVWTSILDTHLSENNTLISVAVGNDGELENQNRIQPPSDLVNALAIGASTTEDKHWEKTSYSCVGPGRSPGFIKPDGVAFGGDENNPFLVYSPITGKVNATAGTSFSSPLVLRTCIGLSSMLENKLNPLAIKALMLHNTEKKKLPKEEIGWGRFSLDINDIILCHDNEVSIVYQGELKAAEYLRVPIPFPSEELTGMVSIKATFCFTADINPAYPDNYTNNGLSVVFRPKQFDGSSKEYSKSKTFFSKSELYETELESRNDAHKWETTLHKEKRFRATSLNNPCFDVSYQARDSGKPIKKEEVMPLPYVLVITLKAENFQELYNKIRQKYETLGPLQVRQDIQVTT